MKPIRARLLVNVTLALAVLSPAILPVLVPATAEAQLVTPEDRCRAELGKTQRRYLERVLKYRMRCQNKVITGDLPLATDCLFGISPY